MSYREVYRRDLRSVYRSRTGTAVAAILALSTVVAIGLFALATDAAVVAAVGGLLTVAVVLTLVFVGSPRSIAIVAGVFTVLAVGITFLVAAPHPNVYQPPMQFAVLGVGSALSFLLPLVGLIGSYAAIVGERETGSVRFLLGLPNSRTDAYVGKLCSRATVVLVPLAVGLVLTGIIVQLTFKDGSLVGMLGLTVVSALYALVFVGIGLTASAYANSTHRAVAVVIAAFVTFRVGVPAARLLAMEQAGNPTPPPEWFYWIGRLNPINAYLKLTTLFAPFEYGHPLLLQSTEAVSTVATSHAFAAVVLLGWAVLAPLVGLLYFQDRDLV